jgi:hypothetical protein
MATTIYVQLASADAGAAIISYFGSPQDPAYWPNQATTDTLDARWSSFYDLAVKGGWATGLPVPGQ